MNCGQFETRLNLLLDQRRSPASDTALAEHAAACSDCDELLADHVALIACASHSRLPPVSDGFAHRVVAATGPAALHQRRSKRLLMAVCVALSSAAAMLLAISIVWKARQADPVDGEQFATNSGVTSADLLVHSTSLWSTEFALAAGGAASRLDEVEKMAPAIRPWRTSFAIIWDALRRAFQSKEHDGTNPPSEERTGQWTTFALSIA